MKHTRLLLLGLALTLAAACTQGETPSLEETAAEAPQGVVDSVYPMEVMLARFRANIENPQRLRGGAGSRDELVEQVVRAMAGADTLAFEELAVGLSEWAWLYFPSSVQAQPPYELPPGMAWLQVQQNNRTGVLRALERFGGQPLDFRGYTCREEPTVEGENRLWTGCLVTLGRNGEQPTPVRLFSSILERDGHFAVLSYANDF